MSHESDWVTLCSFLVQETSRMTFQTAPRQMWKRIRGNERKQLQYIFNPKVQAKVEDITLVTR